MTRASEADEATRSRDWLWVVVSVGALTGGIGALAELTELRDPGFVVASAAVAAIVVRALVRRARGSS